MKIALIGNANSEHIIKFANEFAKKDLQVTVFSLSVHMDGKNQLDKKVNQVYLKGKLPFAYYTCAKKLQILLRKGEFDVINAHYASGYGTLARLAKARPLVLNVWGSDVYEFPYESKYKYRTILKNLKFADCIASTSHAMAEHTKHLMGNTDQIIRVTPFGVDLNTFTVKETFKRSNSDKISISIVKSLKVNYGIQHLLHAFKIVKEKYGESREIELNIYGEGNYRDTLVELMQELQLQQSVQFKGFVLNKELPSILKDEDIFVQVSDRESFGVAAIEAMAVGLPIVATDTDGFREVIEDGTTGIIVPCKDAESLASAICGLIEDSERRESFGLAGRKRVEKLYDLTQNVEQLIEVYKTVM